MSCDCRAQRVHFVPNNNKGQQRAEQQEECATSGTADKLILLGLYSILLGFYPIILSIYSILLGFYPIILCIYSILLGFYPIIFKLLSNSFRLVSNFLLLSCSFYPTLLGFSSNSCLQAIKQVCEAFIQFFQDLYPILFWFLTNSLRLFIYFAFYPFFRLLSNFLGFLSNFFQTFYPILLGFYPILYGFFSQFIKAFYLILSFF